MATGASTCDLAVLLVDARKGVLTQTRRHACIVSLLGIRHLALAVNKMDLVDFGQARFDAIADDFTTFAEPLGFDRVTCIPVSALQGRQCDRARARICIGTAARRCSGISRRSTVTRGPASEPFRFPVQWVNRPHLDFRGYAGTVASGKVTARRRGRGPAVGQARACRAHRHRRRRSRGARRGDAVTLTFADEVDVSRGDVIAPPDRAPAIADQFAAHIVWFDEEPMLPGPPLRA